MDYIVYIMLSLTLENTYEMTDVLFLWHKFLP